MFEVGDRVWCCFFGWGEVVEIDNNVVYSVYCDFENEKCGEFSQSGHFYLDSPRALFFEEVIPQESALTKKRIK
jgi:hypothetical protein